MHNHFTIFLMENPLKLRILSFLLVSSFCLSNVIAQQDLKNRLTEIASQRATLKNSGSKLTLGLEAVYAPGAMAQKAGQFIRRDGKILISAIPDGNATSLIRDLEQVGAENCKSSMNVVQAWIAIDQLPQLEDIPTLVCAMPEYLPTQNSGIVSSQGSKAMRSDLINSFKGIDGTGVTIGIMSDSYNLLNGEAAGISSGDLPGPGNPNGFTTAVEVLSESDQLEATDEGRAMAELIHDVAPGATLKFYSADNGFYDFAEGIQVLANAGCDVIVDDIGYFVSPSFQDGYIAQYATAASQQGVAYFSAAGNCQNDSYEAYFTPSGFNLPGFGEFHDFGGGDIAQNIVIPPGGEIDYWLQWDDHSKLFADLNGPDAETDIDIYLFDPLSGSFVAESNFDNVAIGAPLEILEYVNYTGAPQELQLLICVFSGPYNKRIKYIEYGDGIMPVEHNTFSGTTTGQSKAEGVYGIGASAYFQTEEFVGGPSAINEYSAKGGVPILLDPQGNRLGSPIMRQQPFLTGPDGANTTFFGSFDREGDGYPNFFGTSAAAPHVAAVAALMLQAYPSLSPFELGEALKNTAEDMDDPSTTVFDDGYDFRTGYGMVQADAALASLSEEADPYRFELFSTETGKCVQTLRDGDVIDLADIPLGAINIISKVEGGSSTSHSVEFKMGGKISRKFTDSASPYALYDDNGGTLKPWNVHLGTYTLSAKALGGSEENTLSFSVINSAQIEEFVLINARTDTEVGELGDVIDLADLGTAPINILAKVNTPHVRGIEFELTGPQSLSIFEHKAPFALFRDDGKGDFYPWKNPSPELGEYTLRATVLGNWHNNSAVPTVEKTFTLIDSRLENSGFRLAHSDATENTPLEGFSIYPNPSNEYVTFSYEGKSDEPIQLEIVNSLGQSVFRKTHNRKLFSKMGFSSLGSGVYIARLSVGEELITQSFLIH